MCLLGVAEIQGAILDTVALVQEFKGEGLGERLARLGVDADALIEVTDERWGANSNQLRTHPRETFVMIYVEALLAGRRLA